MTTEVGSAFVSIVPSMKGFGSKLSSEAGSAGSTAGGSSGGKFKSGFLGGLKGMAGPLAATLGVAAVGGFLKSSISSASDLAESASKVNVVFGKQGAAIQKASETSAKSMGLSKQAYLEATGGLGNLLVSLDIAPKKASGMSQSMVKLAGDMASFNNVSPEEALAAIQSGLTGETEPLKKFGVNMNDATLKAQALKMGLIKSTKEAMTPHTKALAAQALIMKQTGTAQGDFARTSGGLANQQRILSAQTADLKTKIGGALLPAVTGLVTFFNNKMLPGIGGITKAFQKGGLSGAIDFVRTAISNALPGIKAKLSEIGTAFVSWVKVAGPPLLVQLGQLWLKIQTWIWTVALPAIIAKLAKWGKAFVEWIGPMIPPALAALGAAGARLFNWLIDVGLPRLLTNLKTWAAAFVAWIKPMIPPILAALAKLAAKLLWWILSSALPKLVGALLKLGWALVKWIAPMIPKALAELVKLGAKLAAWVVTNGIPLLARKFLSLGVKAVTALREGFIDKWEGLKSWLTELPGKMVAAWGNLGTKMFNAGKAAIQSLIDGIGSMVKRLAGAMAHAVKKGITDLIPGSPVKAGPLRVLNDGYAGGLIPRMLAEGITGGTGQVAAASALMAGAAIGTVGVGGTGAVSANLTDTAGIMARQSNEQRHQTDLLEKQLARLASLEAAVRARTTSLVTV